VQDGEVIEKGRPLQDGALNSHDVLRTRGPPACRALAEDIVRGSATLHDCVFAMRDELAGTDMQEYIPAPFRSTGKKEETK